MYMGWVLCASMLIVYMGAIYMHIDVYIGATFMYMIVYMGAMYNYIDSVYGCHIHVY